MSHYLPFDPNPRPPETALPPGACDSQFHVFGEPERYPPRPGAAYTMPSATIERALALHRTLGIERGVIVQPTTYGADHRATLDGLAAAGPNYRACANAAVFGEASEAELARMDEAGVKGVRFTRATLGLAFTQAELDRAFGLARELGWYVKVQPETDGIAANIGPFENVDVPLLIDHLGRPDPTRGRDDPSLRKVLELLGRGNAWVMVSLVEKISKAGPPWDDVVPIVHAVLDAAPDRVVWASDWPHPVSTKQPPNVGLLLDFLHRATRSDEERRSVLVDNPARLFGFEN
jgi:predicted TIM-barrel fold metal-dependent hydrolase